MEILLFVAIFVMLFSALALWSFYQMYRMYKMEHLKWFVYALSLGMLAITVSFFEKMNGRVFPSLSDAILTVAYLFGFYAVHNIYVWQFSKPLSMHRKVLYLISIGIAVMFHLYLMYPLTGHLILDMPQMLFLIAYSSIQLSVFAYALLISFSFEDMLSEFALPSVMVAIAHLMFSFVGVFNLRSIFLRQPLDEVTYNLLILFGGITMYMGAVAFKWLYSGKKISL